ncbi:MAG: (2Fe-2S)-binding protein [Anaerolineae bacterium]|nr:(2Fe-2S)-binding protein [Gloeobacterales cyanobacterium ES-bin-313]
MPSQSDDDEQKDVQPQHKGQGVSRRGFLVGAGLTTAGASIVESGLARQAEAAEQSAAANKIIQPGMIAMALQVNGQPHRFTADLRTTLLDALREKIGLTGCKKGCDHGQCGACTLHVDSRRVLSCLTLAVSAQGKQVTTVEGLAKGDTLHPMQQAFIDHDAFQCGYCTPGQIMSAVAMVNEGHASTDEEIREQMSGNLCRCAAYPNIVAAVNQAKSQMRRI